MKLFILLMLFTGSVWAQEGIILATGISSASEGHAISEAEKDANKKCNNGSVRLTEFEVKEIPKRVCSAYGRCSLYKAEAYYQCKSAPTESCRNYRCGEAPEPPRPCRNYHCY